MATHIFTSVALFFVLLAVLLLHVQARDLSRAGAQAPMGSIDDQSSQNSLSRALRRKLWEGGWNEVRQQEQQQEEVDELRRMMYEAGARLLSLRPAHTTGYSKRTGWKRITAQTRSRYAPFGTKLVPSPNRGDSNGRTLLRYGRSSW